MTAPIAFDLLANENSQSARATQIGRQTSMARLTPPQHQEANLDVAAASPDGAQQNSAPPLSLNSLNGTSSAYNQLIQLIYQHRIYPQDCLRLRQQGQVTLSFFIDQDGQIQNIEVVEASQHSLLNQAARATLRRVRLNDGLHTLFNRSYTFTFEFVINQLSS